MLFTSRFNFVSSAQYALPIRLRQCGQEFHEDRFEYRLIVTWVWGTIKEEGKKSIRGVREVQIPNNFQIPVAQTDLEHHVLFQLRTGTWNLFGTWVLELEKSPLPKSPPSSVQKGGLLRFSFCSEKSLKSPFSGEISILANCDPRRRNSSRFAAVVLRLAGEVASSGQHAGSSDAVDRRCLTRVLPMLRRCSRSTRAGL